MPENNDNLATFYHHWKGEHEHNFEAIQGEFDCLPLKGHAYDL